MKKTWILIALTAAFCAACDDDELQCVNDTATCKVGENDSSVLVVCKDGVEQETVCKTGYICDASKGRCVEVAQCSNDMKVTCDEASGNLIYCSNNTIATTDCQGRGCGINASGNAVCNLPADTTKECTSGAERCNVSGEREKCSAAGVWEANPCCSGSGECLTKCTSDSKKGVTCASIYAEGTTQCVDSSSYRQFTKGAWSTQQCPAATPLCSGDKCIAPEWSYCGTETVPLTDGTSSVFDTYCKQIGSNYIGICYKGEPANCYETCTAANVGKTQNICDTYGTTSGGTADFALQQTCTDLGDGSRRVWIDDEDTTKSCANACNATKTDCDEKGYGTNSSSDNEDPYVYCGTATTEDGTTVASKCGTGKVGLCSQNSNGEYGYTCFDACTEAQVGTKKSECGEVPVNGTNYTITENLVCKSYSGNYAYGLFGTYTVCNGSCNTEKTSCDSQGGTEYGSEYGSSSGTAAYEYCGSEQYEDEETNKTWVISEYCATIGTGYLGICDNEGYFDCYKPCTSTQAGTAGSGVCYEVSSGSYEFPTVCTVVDSTYSAYLVDWSSDKSCTNGCNTDNTACK